MSGDRSAGTLVMALVALGLLAGATVAPWFVYEFNSGRQTPPDGPQPGDETGVESRQLTFYATGWEGDTEPSDPGLARLASNALVTGLVTMAGLLLLVVLGEIPGIDRVLRRPASLTLLAVAFVLAVGLAVLAGLWIPASMAGHGVGGPYTARLDEPDGYTRAYMHTAWYLAMLVPPVVFSAGLWKFQAGPEPREVLEARLGHGGRDGEPDA